MVKISEGKDLWVLCSEGSEHGSTYNIYKNIRFRLEGHDLRTWVIRVMFIIYVNNG